MADKSFMKGIEVPKPPEIAAGAPYRSVPQAPKPDYQKANNQVTAATAGNGKIWTPQSIEQKLETEANPHSDSGAGTTLKLEFQPNILDNYDVVTYHFKLFMVGLDSSIHGTYLAPNNQVIIAESGVSDLTIDKVEINSIAVPSVAAGTGTSTLIKFEISEPGGAGLLDKMFYQAIALGIGNWFVMPCYLQLSFKARTPGSSNSESGGLSVLKWVWPIKLSNARANVTTSGTRYAFEAIVYNELAQSDAYFKTQQNINLENFTTFESAIRDLEIKLNQDQFLKYGSNYSILDTYRFVIDPVLANEPLLTATDNEDSARSNSYEEFKGKTANFATGTSIDKIVDSLLSRSEKFQASMTSAKNQVPGEQPANINDQIHKMKKFWRVTTETRPIAFDYKRQDNAVEIVIFIFEYEISANPAGAASLAGTEDTLRAAKQQLNEYVYKQILKKKYNYIFTGLNDQVINFDLNMNFSFAAALSRFGGVFQDSAGSDKGVVMQRNAEAEMAAAKEVTNVLTMVNKGESITNPEKFNEARDKANQAVAAATFTNNQKLFYTKMMSFQTPAERTAFSELAAKKGGVMSDGEIDKNYEQAVKNSKFLSKRVGDPTTNHYYRFISDININSQASKEAYEDFAKTTKTRLHPIAFKEGPNESRLGSGGEGSSNSGRTKLASLFSTALYSTLDASLLNIRMTIKGDPYWIFPEPITNKDLAVFKGDIRDLNEVFEMIKGVQKRGSQNSSTVNLFGTDNFIAVRFRTPRIYGKGLDVNTTNPHTDVKAFTGVYRVLTIISKFENGKFTQELTCMLDPVIDTDDLIKRMENDSKIPDVPTQADRLLAGKPIVETAVKTQRMGPPTELELKNEAMLKANGLKQKVSGLTDTVRDKVGVVQGQGAVLLGKYEDFYPSNVPAPQTNELVQRSTPYIPNNPDQS